VMTDNNLSPGGLSPVRATDRIESLDVLRGFAVLGILIMNIQSFSMITAAYINPAAYGDLTGVNKWVWLLGQVLASGKFMTIFSALFGAGILFFWDKARSAGKRAGNLHYRRIFWLLLIGLIHAYFFWYGDILVAYALCGVLVFLFRKIKPGWLLFLGFCAMLVPFLIYTWGGMTIEFWPAENYQGSLESWLPTAETIQHDLNAYRGPWLERMKLRAEKVVFMETFYFLIKVSWQSGGIMLLGMALYKWDFLSARRSVKTYLASMILGLLLGLPPIIYGILQNFKHEWFHDYSMWFGSQFNYWGSLGISLAYISAIMLICKAGVLTGFRKILGLVGRTALSNYLFQTLICTFIFYGYGLGLYGYLERWQQIMVVPCVWVIQMTLTWIWMKKYRFGPAEWLWRSLTYWKIQPIRKNG
jgi:uncharacterized protein